MACCGGERAHASRTAIGIAVPSGTPTARDLKPRVAPGAVFEYVGQTALTATGGTTRRPYFFAMPGARVTVDPRDAISMRAIPLLRHIPPNDI